MGCGLSTYDRNSIKGAGCIFTDGNLVIAGYQPNKKVPIISGFGGSKMANENCFEAAHREFLEEMFGIEGDDLLKVKIHIETDLQNGRLFVNGNYINLLYSFEDLEKILIVLGNLSFQSKFYDKFPGTISELIFNRKILVDAEVQHMVILPLVKNINISRDFISDIKILLK